MTISSVSEAIALIKERDVTFEELTEVAAFFSESQHTILVSKPERVYHSRCDQWFKRTALKVFCKTTGETVKTRRNRYICPVCSQYDANGKMIAPVTFTGYRAGHPKVTTPYTPDNLEVLS